MKLRRLASAVTALVLGTGLALGSALSASATTYNPTECGVPLSTTTTVSDGIPGANYYKLLQCYAKLHGSYTGPIDGAPGVNTWKGLQRAAVHFVPSCYAGPIDGANPNYIKALQCIAKYMGGGYAGPIDGVAGPNTYKASAGYFNYLLVTTWSVYV